MDTSKREIAASAARLVVEEGLEYGPAKRRALRDLGLSARTPLPNNDEVEAEVREYIELFCADTQPQELHALRLLALEWMERMAAFRPHVGGAVWHGTATRLSDIYIQLFCDDSKSAEIALIDHHVDYEPRMVTGFHGEQVEALSVHAPSRALGEEIGVHLLVYDLDDLRGALKPDAQGRTPRGDLPALRRLIEREKDTPPPPPPGSVAPGGRSAAAAVRQAAASSWTPRSGARASSARRAVTSFCRACAASRCC